MYISIEKKHRFYTSAPSNALFLEDLYKTAFEISFVDSRFSDFTDKVLQRQAFKRTPRSWVAIRFTLSNMPLLSVTTDRIPLISCSRYAKYSDANPSSLGKKLLSLCEENIKINNALAKRFYPFQFSFEEARYGDVTEDDYTALLELRRILQID